MSDQLAKRLLIIGWDAADWKLIDPLLSAGIMPNLSRLIANGVRSDLSSLDPKLSPILWTSIATGKTADKHGILNFIEPDSAGGIRVVASTSRKAKALWNILTQNDRRSIVVNWYASHPAEPICGSVVSNMFQEGQPRSAKGVWPVPAGAIHPAETSEQIASARVRSETIALGELRQFFPSDARLSEADRRVVLLRKLLGQCRSVHAAAIHLMTEESDWDCAMVFYDMIDVAGHHFMQYHAPRMSHVTRKDFAMFGEVMNGVYRLHDRLLGELLAAAGDGVTMMILSDHGFHSDHLRPPTSAVVHDEHAAMDATWHRPTGMLVMSGPGIQSGATLHSPGLLDIAPTALALLGLPASEDMDGRALAEALSGRTALPRISSWDAREGEAGLHPANLRTDAFEANAALQQLADLGYIQPIGADIQATIEKADTESRFNLGVVYMSTHRQHQALAVFQRLHAEHPEETRFLTNMAHCLQVTGQASEAEMHLTRFIQAHPERHEIRLMQAAVLATQGRFDEAVAIVEEAHQRNPSDLETMLMLVDHYRLANRLGDARVMADRALKIDPRNPAALHARAWVSISERAFESAADDLLTALEIRHIAPGAHYTLGVALAWLGELDHARASFQIAISQQPGLINAHRFLLAISERTDDAEGQRLHAAEVERLNGLAARPNSADSDALGPKAWLLESGKARNGASPV